MLYVKVINAIYGIMKVEILYHKNFVGDITTSGFNINPYGKCVAKNLINVKKMTVVWHIDDIKVNHESTSIFTRMSTFLKKTCEIYFEDGRGKSNTPKVNIYEYLGTTWNIQNHDKSRLL